MAFSIGKLIPLVICLALWAAPSALARVKVACLGNSITFGLGLSQPDTQSYPAQLQSLLGNDYEVRNFGHSGAAVLINGHHPYTQTPEYNAALDFKPDIAVIHLGTNDTDPRSWPNFSHQFTADYLHIINQLRQANPNIRILLAKLSPIRATHPRFCSGTRIWRLEAQDFIERIASQSNLELIDFNAPLVNRQDLLSDGLHPNAEGAALLAQEAYRGITGHYGPLSMPPVYSSGMVLPHGRYITLHGNSNANALIKLTINRHTYRTRTSGRGQWQITIPPLSPGRKYDITVTDGTDSLHFTNILAGVVFLASGQSNMAFTLAEDSDGPNAIKSSADSLLRFYSMFPRYYTGNFEWSEQQRDSVNNLQYFLPADWQSVNPHNAPLISAAAYYFARELRDSLNIPVGIISNAVGGATLSSWIDINTLEQDMPLLLLNWRSNDYIQPWAQSRATLNSGSTSRHPYEPSYLFSAGITPLGHYPINGVLWYQGESNAHNIEVHESLFKAFVNSWRTYFNNLTLPIYFAQLSSLTRPSWPSFRNSQRLLASSIPHTAMAVTSDYGDSLNVHPPYKKPVGTRLARLALQHSFNHPLNAHGPEPVKAEIVPEGIKISFNHANGLSVSHGLEPITFEVAGDNRVYSPAKAKIINDHIILFDMDTPQPRFVRYGWQPFTRANLINSDSLPASTFEIEVDNPTLRNIEQGIEAGLSGCFAASVGSKLVIAGGCNFPGDPFAPHASKKFYQGIYTADSTQMLWQLVGQLPEPTAYGATAVTPKGIALIGGTSPSAPLTRCLMLTFDNNQASLSPLPSLPEPIDNAYAAALGSRIYLAGGNLNGVPSRALFMLDTDAQSPKWQRLSDMPGNPRVQPVMAAAKNSRGETCLYIFGGFAPRHNGLEPTLQLDGLCFNPATGKWQSVKGPVAPDGTPLAVGGGAACTLSSGLIAVCGGVNKDVFLEALRNQAPDYLSHEPDWYRFNPYTLLFDAKSQSWLTPVPTQIATARAGAAIFPDSDNSFFIYGGELKPRVRSSEITRISL